MLSQLLSSLPVQVADGWSCNRNISLQMGIRDIGIAASPCTHVCGKFNASRMLSSKDLDRGWISFTISDRYNPPDLKNLQHCQ